MENDPRSLWMEMPVPGVMGRACFWEWFRFGDAVSWIYLKNSQVASWQGWRYRAGDMRRRMEVGAVTEWGFPRRLCSLSRAEHPDRAQGHHHLVGRWTNVQRQGQEIVLCSVSDVLRYLPSPVSWAVHCWFRLCTKWEDTGSSKINVHDELSFLAIEIILFTIRYSVVFQMVTMTGSMSCEKWEVCCRNFQTLLEVSTT